MTTANQEDPFSIASSAAAATVEDPNGILGAGASLLSGVVVFAAKFIVVAFLTALLESMVAKMRFYRLQEYFTTAYLLAFFGLILSLIF